MQNDTIKRRIWISVTYFIFILTKKNFVPVCVIKSQIYVETKHVACKININFELCVTLKKNIFVKKENCSIFYVSEYCTDYLVKIINA